MTVDRKREVQVVKEVDIGTCMMPLFCRFVCFAATWERAAAE